MPKKVLLIGYNFSPEPTGIGKYSGEMMHWLAESGYDCTVITAYPYYPYWKVQNPYRKTMFLYTSEKEVFESGGKIVVYRCPMYVPNKPTSRRRMVLDFSFFVSALSRLAVILWHVRFDHVIAVAPSFQFGLLGVIVKKLQRAKFSYHIQDLQIEAARDLKMIKSKQVLNTLFKLETYIMRQADFISSISVAMISKIESKCHKPIHLFANWVDTDIFSPILDREALKKAMGYDPADKIILYSGSVGKKQGLEDILETAKDLEDVKHVRFLLCGSGPFVDELQRLSEKMGLSNVHFMPLQPMSTFNRLLNCADVHLVIQKSTAADLMLPSKLTTIWAVGGVPLVTACPGSQLYRTIQKHRIGLVIPPDDQRALSDGVRIAISQDWHTLSQNARRYALNHLSKESIMRMFESQVLVPDVVMEEINEYVPREGYSSGRAQ